MPKRFEVHEVSQLFRTVREPYQVVDTATNEIVDEYASKRAAQMDARQRNEETGE